MRLNIGDGSDCRVHSEHAKKLRRNLIRQQFLGGDQSVSILHHVGNKTFANLKIPRSQLIILAYIAPMCDNEAILPTKFSEKRMSRHQVTVHVTTSSDGASFVHRLDDILSIRASNLV